MVGDLPLYLLTFPWCIFISISLIAHFFSRLPCVRMQMVDRDGLDSHSHSHAEAWVS